MNTEWRKLGEAGVDAGLLMIADPCYFIPADSDAGKQWKGNWSKFLKDQNMGDDHQMNYHRGHAGLGVVASTAYGDGIFSVFGLFEVGQDKDNQRPLAMMVVTGDIEDIPQLPTF